MIMNEFPNISTLSHLNCEQCAFSRWDSEGTFICYRYCQGGVSNRGYVRMMETDFCGEGLWRVNDMLLNYPNTVNYLITKSINEPDEVFFDE